MQTKCFNESSKRDIAKGSIVKEGTPNKDLIPRDKKLDEVMQCLKFSVEHGGSLAAATARPGEPPPLPPPPSPKSTRSNGILGGQVTLTSSPSPHAEARANAVTTPPHPEQPPLTSTTTLVVSDIGIRETRELSFYDKYEMQCADAQDK